MTRRFLAGCLLAACLPACMVDVAYAQRERPRPEVRGTVKAVDAGGRSLTVAVGNPREGLADKVFALAENVEVAFGGFGGGRGGAYQEAKLADLSAGTGVWLSLSADEKTVESILAEEPVLRGVLQKVDPAAKTLSLETSPAARGQPGESKTLAVADDAEIAVDDGRGRRFSIREAALGDLKQGSFVTVWLTLDRQTVRGALAEGPSLQGTVKAFDAGSRSLTLALRPPRGDDAGDERTLVVAPDATILLDDGRGRRLSVKLGKLSDVPLGSAASVRLSADQGRVMQLRAEGPTLFGRLKSADSEKGTITIAVPRGRGEEPEEKTIPVAKDARVYSEGVEVPLADLKPADNGPIVQLRLSLDQTKAQLVTARLPQR